MDTKIVEILKSVNSGGLEYFVAILDNGGVRYGVATKLSTGGLIQNSLKPEIIARTIEIAKIEDNNEFEEAVDELFH